MPDPNIEIIELKNQISSLTSQLHAIRKQTVEECASALEDFSFPMDIDWWLNSTKKTISSVSVLKAAEHLRDIANGTPKTMQEQVMALLPTTAEGERK